MEFSTIFCWFSCFLTFFLFNSLIKSFKSDKTKRFCSIFKSCILEMEMVGMRGLMASVAEFGHFQPLRDARIMVLPGITHQTSAFVETLTALGAEVGWCSSKIFSAQDHAAATIPHDTEHALDWGPDLIVDYGGDATLLIHEGVKAEKIFAETGQVPEIVQTIIRDGLKTDPKRYHKIKKKLLGVSVETSTGGAKMLLQLQSNGTLLFSVISISESVSESKIMNSYGRRYALLNWIKRETNKTMISGKIAAVFGYEDGSKVCAIALKQAGAKVIVSAVDPNQAVQARLRGFSVVQTLDDVVSKADIFVTSDAINHEENMKNDAIIYNMDPKTDKSVFPNVTFWSCTCHVVALLDLWSKRETSGKYEKKVYALPEHLVEKVSDLHLAKLSAAYVEMTENVDTSPSTEPKKEKSGKIRRILLMGTKGCGLFGMLAMGLMNGSKVLINLSFPKVCIDMSQIFGAFMG